MTRAAHKANLFATFGPDGDGGYVLSGHTDVVPVDGQDWSSRSLQAAKCATASSTAAAPAT